MKTIYVNPWGGIIPGNYSCSAVTFTQELEKLEYLVFYVLAAERIFATRYNEFKDESLDYIRSLGPKFQESFDHIIAHKGDRLILSGKSYENLPSQMTFSRTVDSFRLYLKNILTEIIQIKPQLLKSGEKEKLDFILDFDDMQELRKALAEKKIESLFYLGFKDICEFFESRVGVKLIDANEDLEKLVLQTRIRNLIVHNSGKINSEFMREFPNYKPLVINGSIRLRYKDLLKENSFILKCVESIDNKITKKFGLSTAVISTDKYGPTSGDSGLR